MVGAGASTPLVPNPGFGGFPTRENLDCSALSGFFDPNFFPLRVRVLSPLGTPRGGSRRTLEAGAGGVAGPTGRPFPGSDSPPNASDISKMVPSPTEEFLSARDNVWIPKCTNFGCPTRMKTFPLVGTFRKTVNGATYLRTESCNKLDW